MRRITQVLFAGIMGLVITLSMAGTATASPPSPSATSLSASQGTAGVVTPMDTRPGPPWVFSGNQPTAILGSCNAQGRAFVNSGRYSDYTCRYIGGVYYLYLLPKKTSGGCSIPVPAATEATSTSGQVTPYC